VTFYETLLVMQNVDYATLDAVGELDLTSPFDELSDLRRRLTTQEIAEFAGLRRETISRARRDSRFRRSTEKSVSDLYAVVTLLTAGAGGDHAHLAAVLRRPQTQFDGRSIAELLKEGKVEVVLEHLAPPAASADEQLENIQFDPATLAALGAIENAAGALTSGSDERRVSELLGADAMLDALLPEIESRIRDHFGADAQIDRAVVADPDEPGGPDRLYLRVRSGLSFDDALDSLTALLDREEARLEPFQDRLTIGIL
jgi:hypothetical protein